MRRSRFQMHYTPTGTEQNDRSSIGLIFAKEPPKVGGEDAGHRPAALRHPAPAPTITRSVSSTTFDKDAILYSMFPHMHLRGKDFHFEVDLSRRQTRDAAVGAALRFRLAVELHPAKSRCVCRPGTQHRMHGPFRQFGEEPEQSRSRRSSVVWGEQTWDEMMIGFMDYAYVEGK